MYLFISLYIYLSINLFVVLDQPSNLRIVADPNNTVAAGKRLTLICTFESGNLPVSIKWKLNNSPMLQQTDRSLVIKNVDISNSGTYECTAINILGMATGKRYITVTCKYCFFIIFLQFIDVSELYLMWAWLAQLSQIPQFHPSSIAQFVQFSFPSGVGKWVTSI